jgi:hypothetical protein
VRQAEQFPSTRPGLRSGLADILVGQGGVGVGYVHRAYAEAQDYRDARAY